MTTLLKAEPKRCALVVVVLLSVLLTGGHAEQCGSQAGGALCANNLCCSQYGWCGSTSAYCGTGCQSQCGTTSNGRCGSQGGGATCANNLCCSQYGYCGSTTDYCGAGCQSQCTPTSGTPPTSDVSSIISSSTFSAFFPYMNSFYSYNAFITAANSFAGFGTSGSSVYQKREVAAFLANVKQETGGLQYIREISPGSNYCDSSNTQYPCASGKSYYGRGPLQLSWNYNYGAAGSYLGLNLLNNPDLLEQDSGASFKASLWFWMQSPSSSSSCHQAIVGGSGFGQTIRIINGGYECGQGTETAAASNRISYYQDLCSRLGVDPGTNLGCA